MEKKNVLYRKCQIVISAMKKKKQETWVLLQKRLDKEVLLYLVIFEHKPDTVKEKVMLRTRKGYIEESVQAEGSVSVKASLKTH